MSNSPPSPNRLVDRPLQRGDRPHIICWFDAWLHDDAPHLGAAFAAEVAKTANRYRAWPRRLLSPLPSAMLSPEERWRRRILLGLGSLAVAVLIALLPNVRAAVKPGATADEFTADQFIRTVMGQRLAPLVLLMLVALAVWRKVFAAAQAAARFVDDPKSEAAGGSMQQVHEQLGNLIRQAVRNPGWFGSWLKQTWPAAARLAPRLRGERRRLVLLVDDLERCRPPRAVEVCEVASQLLGHPDVVTILVADMSTVAMSAEIKYAKLETGSRQDKGAAPSFAPAKGGYGRSYLQKMVQLQFDLPPTSLESVRGMVTSGASRPDEPKDEGDFQIGTRPSRSVGGKSSANGSRKTDNVTQLKVISGVTGMITAVAGLSGLFGALFSQDMVKKLTIEVGSWVATISWTVAGLSAVVTVASSIVVRWMLERRRQASQRIDKEIKARVTDEGDVQSLKAAVLESEAAREGGVGLASHRFERFITDDSILREQAESEILKFLPRVPRSAKRLANHLRLLLVVASERKMLGGVPPLESAHLGKWIVLLERWPEVGWAVRANPALLADMEKRASDDPSGLADTIRAFAPRMTDFTTVTEFFRAEPALTPVVLRLIYCLPATVTVVDETA
jgi:uncharacterized membrane protein YuzA (DUF378 family)